MATYQERVLLDAIDDLWPEVAVGFNKNHCILSTRTAIEVANYFGYTWNPLPVDLAIFNVPGLVAFKTGLPVNKWPDEAWSIGCQCEDTLSPETNGWDGHLIIESRDWVADLATSQFDRPAKNMHIPTWILDKTEEPPPWWWTTNSGLGLYLKPHREMHAYKRSNDWRINYKPLAAALIKELSNG